jgi:hypothetical protein
MARGTDNNQHNIGSKDTVAVATAMETVAVGKETSATARQRLPRVFAQTELLCHHRGRRNDCRGHSKICRKSSKDCLALLAGSSAHSAVLAPLLGGGACTTFPVGSRGGGGHDGRVVCAGCDSRVWGCAC